MLGIAAESLKPGAGAWRLALALVPTSQICAKLLFVSSGARIQHHTDDYLSAIRLIETALLDFSYDF